MSNIHYPKVARHGAQIWASVLSEEIHELTSDQVRAHLAAALQDVADGNGEGGDEG